MIITLNESEEIIGCERLVQLWSLCSEVVGKEN